MKKVAFYTFIVIVLFAGAAFAAEHAPDNAVEQPADKTAPGHESDNAKGHEADKASGHGGEAARVEQGGQAS